jgi:hypothetical protein
MIVTNMNLVIIKYRCLNHLLFIILMFFFKNSKYMYFMYYFLLYHHINKINLKIGFVFLVADIDIKLSA